MVKRYADLMGNHEKRRIKSHRDNKMDSLPIEGLTEAANETAKTGALTGGLADALNWAGVNEDDFKKKLEKCNTEQERAALITETMNGLYSDASKQYQEVNKDVIAANKAQDRLNKTMADVGGALEPFVTKGKELVGEFLEKAIPYIENLADAALPWLEDRFADLEVGIGKVSDGVEWAVDKFGEFTDWCSEHQGTIETVAIVIGSFAAAWALVNTAVGIWTGVATAAAAATTALSTAIAILTSPITIAIAIIGAIIAVGVLLWKNWDEIKAKAAELWQALTEKFQQIKDNTVAKVEEIKTNTVQKFQEMKEGVERWVSNLYSKAKEKFESTKSTISLAISEAKQKVVDTFTGMYDAAVEKAEAIRAKVKEKFEEAKAAITKPIEEARESIKKAIEKIKNFFDFKLKIDISWPEIKVSGGKAPWGLGGEGYPPSIDIEWHAKAMDKAMILDDPTLFGYQNGKFLGGGEAGREVVVGESHLLDMMAKVVAKNAAASDEQIIALLIAILEAITDGNSDLLRALRAGHVLRIGEREFGRLVKQYA